MAIESGCQPIYRSFDFCSRHRSALINVIWYAVVHLLMKHFTFIFFIFHSALHAVIIIITAFRIYEHNEKGTYRNIIERCSNRHIHKHRTQNAYFNKCVFAFYSLSQSVLLLRSLSLSLSCSLPIVCLSFCSCGSSSKIHLQNISSSVYVHHKPHYYKPQSYHFPRHISKTQFHPTITFDKIYIHIFKADAYFYTEFAAN